MKGISKLALKFIIGFILLGILISAACSLVGYSRYKNSIERQYNNTAYQVAQVALSYVPMEDIAAYVEAAKGFREGTVTQEQLDTLIAEEKYQDAVKKLEALRSGMGANDIFFVYTDLDLLKNFDGNMEGWQPLSYLLDCYTVPELNYVLGNMGPFNPDYIKDALYVNEEGKRANNYFVSKSQYGYNTSAMLPIIQDGKVIATVGVEIPMSTIEKDLRSFLISTVVLTVAVIVVFLFVYMLYLFTRVIRPINLIAKEVSSFVENETAVSENLKKINTHDEIQNLADNTLKMQVDIQNYIQNITAITAEKERIGAELNVATHIQSSMLPCIFPAFPEHEEFDVYATMNPAKEVGGDFYDFFLVDETHIAIVMADVSGKGVPAALFMVIAKTLIKDHTSSDTNLGTVFSVVNRLLCESNSEGMFVTAFEGVLDLVTGEFIFVNAGHEMPFICKKGEKYEPYKIRAGFVLAGMEEMRYRSGTLTLEPGDKIFQYTDGVTEATDANNQLYGMDRLHTVLADHSELSPMELLPVVKADIDAFVGAAPQFDDITMLCLEYKKKAEQQ